jgi:hypothetical protein
MSVYRLVCSDIPKAEARQTINAVVFTDGPQGRVPHTGIDDGDAPPSELVFQFHANHKFFRIELLNRGRWGVDAQIIEAPDDLRIGHRFDRREQAVLSAESIRRTWGPDPSHGCFVQSNRGVSLHHGCTPPRAAPALKRVLSHQPISG